EVPEDLSIARVELDDAALIGSGEVGEVDRPGEVRQDGVADGLDLKSGSQAGGVGPEPGSVVEADRMDRGLAASPSAERDEQGTFGAVGPEYPDVGEVVLPEGLSGVD